MTTVVSCIALMAAAVLPTWEFDADNDFEGWIPNAHITDSQVSDGVLNGEVVGTDASCLWTGEVFPVSAWNQVRIRFKSQERGSIELFWTGDTSGQYGGLSREKAQRVTALGGDQWQVLVVTPFWHQEGSILRMRLDFDVQGPFAVDYIRVTEWGAGTESDTSTVSWQTDGTSGWTHDIAAGLWLSPRLELDTAGTHWMTFVASTTERWPVARIFWGVADAIGAHETYVPLHGDGRDHVYNVPIYSAQDWDSFILALGLGGPSSLDLKSVQLADVPGGPPEPDVVYAGFDNAPVRTGQPARITAHVVNRGSQALTGATATLRLPDGVQITGGTPTQAIGPLTFATIAELHWTVTCSQAGDFTASLGLDGYGGAVTHGVPLHIVPAVQVESADYVPAPQPVATSHDVLMYYFPGWESRAKWTPIEQVAPNRKPVLGYYDESREECVDWQIKWAVENGISGFLVDWYWVQGKQMLDHWIKAYKKARHRDMLDIAIMWANHNEPGTHSVQDMLDVTQFWIDNYFHLDSYYRMDNRPAVFIWDPAAITDDLGGRDVVRSTLNACRDLARDAGYEGIYFVALAGTGHFPLAGEWAYEGYEAITSYHEWANVAMTSRGAQQSDFTDIVSAMPESWQENRAQAGSLRYLPVVDTGWDARPWHGNTSMVLHNRSPENFRQLLEKARDYAHNAGESIVVLGPANEWGEGSYIEPCTEFGFRMYEAIRSVFSTNAPASWPTNIAPVDVGLGPYDLPEIPSASAWHFDSDLEGWSATMGLSGLRQEAGMLKVTATSNDPALTVATVGLSADRFNRVAFRMRLTGTSNTSTFAQLFWAKPGEPISASASTTVTAQVDGEWHEYEVSLADNPAWWGEVYRIRFDPCATAGLTIELDHLEFQPRQQPKEMAMGASTACGALAAMGLYSTLSIVEGET